MSPNPQPSVATCLFPLSRSPSRSAIVATTATPSGFSTSTIKRSLGALSHATANALPHPFVQPCSSVSARLSILSCLPLPSPPSQSLPLPHACHRGILATFWPPTRGLSRELCATAALLLRQSLGEYHERERERAAYRM